MSQESDVPKELLAEQKASEPVGEEISKDQKKALGNFRDQVRYKDYKGLVKTLQTLEPVVKDPSRHRIPEKYASKYEMIQENVLLLKNIIISDIKYSISNEKALDKNVVLLSTLLSDKYTTDVQTSIVTWMSNTTLSIYTKELQKIEKLSETAKALELLLMIKDKVGIKSAHLPIWWSISKIVLGDLAIILKNKLIRVIDKGGFSDEEYLTSFKECVEFERVYLVPRTKSKRAGSPKEVTALKLSETSPKHLQLLEDISNERPLCTEEVNENSLSLAFIPCIDIYIKHHLSSLEKHKFVFLDKDVHATIYDTYTTLTNFLAKLAYFKFPSVGHAFLSLVDATIAKIIIRSPFANAEKNFISGIESVYYIKETSEQMAQHLEELFGLGNLSSDQTLAALDDLANRIFASYSVAMQRRFVFITKQTITNQSLQKHLEPLLATLLPEIEAFAQLTFTNTQEIIEEWLEVLGQSIINVLSDIKLKAHQAEYLLCFMSALEVPIKNAIFTQLNQDITITTLDRAKLYLKLFLISPEMHSAFIDNFHKLSNGLFHFHQVLAKVSKKTHRKLIEEYNRTIAAKQKDPQLVSL
ncbi:hypothetical protein NEHOM01_0198 [Nematocida homosporus]|uniref:uncharacterized protein n=1 Tax=Nematocida homosporus TaxID=1912981 RepID=UPI00221FF089|nr:uncharacterized protein NEHOM01_0198 [Nematocida homosporus]KAI5184523.1 hypothetical protein NEHOM01_0198 [Nematocida homosporus]